MRKTFIALVLLITACGRQAATPPTPVASTSPDPYSRMEEGSEPLLDLTKQVAADFGYWRDRGVDLKSVHPDAKRGVVVIGAENPDAVRAQLERHYQNVSPAKIAVEQGESGTPLRWPRVNARQDHHSMRSSTRLGLNTEPRWTYRDGIQTSSM